MPAVLRALVVLTVGVLGCICGATADHLSAETTYPAGVFSTFVAVGDFDADGHKDLAVANRGSADVSVLLGRGDGTFGPQARFAVGWEPVSIAVADYDGDGLSDLAVANQGSHDVSVLLGFGDGTFAAQRRTSAGFFPFSLGTADFNADEIPDLAVANASSSFSSILLGVRGGAFTQGLPFSNPSDPGGLVVSDFNRDGRPDIAIAGYLSVQIHTGRGDGTFELATYYPAGPSPRSIVQGDFDGDGYQDLATADIGSQEVFVLLGLGDGTFTPVKSYPAGPGLVAAAPGDFNEDGVPDLAVASGGVLVLPGFGDGSFGQPRPLGENGYTYHVASGDFNEDGLEDLVSAESLLNGQVRVFLAPFQLADAPPIAVAGPDLINGNCNSPEGVRIPLDGSESSDADSSPGTNNDIVSFEWIENFGQPSEKPLASGEVAEVMLPLGRHVITLRVTDHVGNQAIDEMIVEVLPVPFRVVVLPAVLWPPDHRMVEVHAQIEATTACGPFRVLLDSVTSSEPDDAPGGGDGNTKNDIAGADVGTPDFQFYLRAERASDGQGRDYCVKYVAANDTGIFAQTWFAIHVPHDSGPVPIGGPFLPCFTPRPGP